MRLKTRLGLVALVALTGLTLAAVAQASRPQAATLNLTMTATGPTTAAGTWTATSAHAVLNGKSGTVSQTIRITGQGKGQGQRAGRIVHGRKQVTAADGTFVIQFVGHMRVTGATTSEVNGRFVIMRGTGAYQGLRGTGRIQSTLNTATGAISATYTGRVHVHGS